MQGQKAARKRVERAQRNLPERAVPTVPVLPHYTPAQVELVRQLIRRSGINRASDAMEDPRTRQRLRGAAAAGRSDLRIRGLRTQRAADAAAPRLSAEEAQAQALGRALAVALGARPARPTGSLRTQRIRAGRQAMIDQAFRDTVAPGPQRNHRIGIGPAAITVNPHAALQNVLATVAPTLVNAGDPAARFVKAGLRDVRDVGLFPLVGGIAGLQALGEAAGPVGALALPGPGLAGWLLAGRPHGGNLKPAKELATGIASGFTHGAVGEALQGNFGKAEQAFLEHPVFSALDASGLASAAGRGAGALARGLGSTVEDAGVRGALARAGSTVRPPLAMTDDASAAANGLHVQRDYSKDSGRKWAQVARDQRREPLRDANGDVVYVTDRGRRVPVLKATEAERERFNKRRANFDASRANARERVARGQADVVDHKTGRVARGKTGKLAEELRVWAVQNVIRTPATLKEDLRKHAARIREELKHPENYPTRREFEEAEAQAKFAEDVSRNPKGLAKAQRLFEVSHEHSRALNAADEAAVKRAVLDPDVAERSPLMTHAISHMDARHVTEEEHVKLEADARAVEDAARAHRDANPNDAAAAQAYRDAREHRIAVSGRHPAKVRVHEAARDRALRKKAAAKRAGQEHAKLVAKRQRLVGAQASRRGTRGMAGQAAAATAAEVRKLAKLDRDIEAAAKRRKAAEKEYRKARTAAKDTKLPPVRAGLRHNDGRHLSSDEIREHIRTGGGDARAARDPATVAYVPHRLEVELKSSHHAAFQVGTRPNFAKGETRTGELFRRGAASHERGLLRDELAKKATHITKAEQLDRAIADAGMKHPVWAKAQRGEPLTKAEQRIVDRGGMFNGKEALEEARRLKSDTGEDFVPVRAYGSALSKEMQERIRSEHQDPAGMETLHSQLFNNRIVTSADGSRARNVVLLPASYVTQLAKHLQPAGELNKFMQILNAPFRMAVLPQFRWLTGNFVEPYVVRLPATGGAANVVGLGLDFVAARRALRSMKKSSDPLERQAAAEMEAQQLGGLFIGRRGASNRRTYEDFTGRTQKVLYAAHVLRNLPVLKQLGDLILTIPKAFFTVNRYLESSAQHVQLGHQVRQDIQAFSGSWLKTLTLGKKAIAETRRGLRGTPTQERFMRAQYRILGQYEGFGPGTRSLIQGLMPFLPWTMAAARFVYWTMPAHHPVLEGLLLHADQAVQQQWDAAHDAAGALPGSLQDALITDKGGFVDVGRYTPFGFSEPIARGDLRGITSPLLPQISGIQAAIEGKDPFGNDLKVEPTPGNPEGQASAGQRILIALNQLAGATIPDYANLQRVREGGGTGYADSTFFSPKVKPGSSHMSGLRRAFDPGRPTYLKGGGGSGSAVPAGASPVQRERIERALKRAASQGPSAVQQDRIRRALERAGG